METNRISLPTAYMIETLRSHGITDQELLHQIDERDVTPWDRLDSRFDFTHLVELADSDQDLFKSIILDGYTIKFVTLNGVKTLLQLKFDKLIERDYQLTETGISGLYLEKHELIKLEQLLSSNCKIYEMAPQSKEISIELV
ncbi:hypothetical protein [Sporosarcina sp. NPDC096371]|uniref:hypothetical protein n=1 Tax=Sporosarcina sp. NPDC096371 TaxID=3364530 RepID=UPI003826C531